MGTSSSFSLNDEDEIDRLARANFERRIGAIVVEHRQRTRGMMMQVSSSLLGHTTTAEKKKKKKKKKKKTTKEEEEEEDDDGRHGPVVLRG